MEVRSKDIHMDNELLEIEEIESQGFYWRRCIMSLFDSIDLAEKIFSVIKKCTEQKNGMICLLVLVMEYLI